MVVRAEGYETSLARAQYDLRAGIFACDDYAVVSDTDLVPLGFHGLKTLLISTTAAPGITSDGTCANTQVFLEAWEQIRLDGRYASHAWVVKADPDTVLIPQRLSTKLAPGGIPATPYTPSYPPKASAGWWVPNCDKVVGWHDLWPMMFGAVEILDLEAVHNFFANVDACKASLDWRTSGEDKFLGQCMRKLQAGEIFLKQGDDRCSGGVCTDPNFQAFHPRKDAAAWLECWAQATK